MKISIIHPHYNHEGYLRQNIEAFRAQTHEDWELLVVDDGSTDGSRALLEDYAARDPRVKPEFLGTNQGAMAALARSQARMTGELVYGNASDDYIENPNFFKIAVKFLRRHAEAGLAFGKSRCIWDDTGALCSEMGHAPEAGFLSPETVFPAFLEKRIFVPGISAILRREHLEALGGFPAELGAQTDYFVNHALAVRHGAVFIPEFFSAARVSRAKKSLSSRGGFEAAARRFALCEARFRAMPGAGAVPPGLFLKWREGSIGEILDAGRQMAALSQFHATAKAFLEGGPEKEPMTSASHAVLSVCQEALGRLQADVDEARRIFAEIAGN